jgi:transcriptional regulator GlxA family with amidase domain
VQTSAGFTVNVRHGLGALGACAHDRLAGIDDLDVPIPASVCRALQRAAARGARLVSICTGAFVLAEAGLLNDRRATTHWMDAPLLASRYPAVTVDPDVLYVDEGPVLTSAGIACGIDLCLHVVRMDYGSAVAAAVAKRLVVAPHRDGSQAQFIVKPTVGSVSDTLEPTRRWAATQLERPITVASMASHAKMPSRTFCRRFQEEVGTSPLRWLVGERLLRARELLETTRLPLAQIADRAGFGTELSLRSHFRARLHTTPAAYRRAFRRPTA